MARILFLLLFACLLVATTMTATHAEPIPEELLRCVGYLTYPDRQSTEKKPLHRLAGTAFIVGYQYEERPKDHTLRGHRQARTLRR